MARTLHTVIPTGMNPAFLNLMRDFDPPTFEENDSEDDTPYFVHVEAGKRIYQIYAELDQPAEDDPDGLAMYLYNTYGTKVFRPVGVSHARGRRRADNRRRTHDRHPRR